MKFKCKKRIRKLGSPQIFLEPNKVYELEMNQFYLKMVKIGAMELFRGEMKPIKKAKMKTIDKKTEDKKEG